MELVVETYKVTENYPKKEMYGVSDQIRRAAVSIPSNIAEGFMRQHNKEFKQYLFIALASSAEVETQLMISNKLGYVANLKLTQLSERLDKLNRMTMSLIKRL